ncbi:putative conserved protein related to C-terminal domain of eukaryotic chaperone, SACSIN [Geoglobus ahangari]|uniref:Putative conserved protein related to C-terminal domain of eukaryotic chaperone, SACSIN n=1 Tax=Geoglobus ahangari TaxID=113653 RepID=A0A0F7ICC2_9EURY|nr:HEPN domain-containing protein [Geoglobus ahangari]AKG90895.1 putative conserved protein related to C-terminal domain of eukaryotic chaperone, SACSIN [Geoglobus ahangari]
MSVEEIEILRDRSEKFLKNARHLYETGIYDLAAFNIQQSVELYLKYRLFLLAGDYPKTHSIKKLLRELGKIAGKTEDVEKFMKENIDRISNLENAYITSRYIPSEFEKVEIENMLDVAEKIRKLVDEL